MKTTLIILGLLLTIITANAQLINSEITGESPIQYTLKINPVSPFFGSFKFMLEKTMSERMTVELKAGFRRGPWSTKSRKTQAGFGTIRGKYYLVGKAQRGLYFGPGVSYEQLETKRNGVLDWKKSTIVAAFVDIGAQIVDRRCVLDFFVGFGAMNDSPSKNKYLDLGTYYGSHLGFSNQLVYRGGIRIGYALY